MARSTWLVGLVVAGFLGCGNTEKRSCEEGTEGCACFANDTCMPGLTCLSHLCVNADGLGLGGFTGFGGKTSSGGAPGLGGARSMGGFTGQAEVAAEPARWFRADEGIELADGRKISSWRDQSAYGAHAMMDTDASRQPEFVAAGLNGKPEVYFGGAQSLYFPVFNSVKFTLFAVGRNSNPTDNFSIIIGPGGDTGNNQLRWDDGDTLMFVGLEINIPVTEFPFGNTRVPHLVSVRNTGSVLEVYRDGELKGQLATVTTGGWDVAQLGGWFSQDFMIGSLSEVVMYDRSLTDAELTGTQAALLEKYGL